MTEAKKAYMRLWRKRNHQRVLEHKRRYYLKHKAKIRAKNDIWFKSHPEAQKVIKRRWKIKNPAKVNAHNRSYRKRHPDKMRELKRRDYIRNKKAYAKRARKWQAANPAKFKDHLHRRRTQKLLLGKINCSKKIAELNRERFCRWCCVRLTPENRTIDHIIPLKRGGYHIPDNLAACCRSCNSKKSSKLVHEWLPTLKEAA